MSRFRLGVFSLGLLSALSFGAQAQESTTTLTTTPVVQKYVIVSPTPKGVCSTVAGTWKGSVWIASHEECKYENRTEGATWVGDYWSCTSSSPDGTCSAWSLVAGHWEAQ